MSKTLHLVLTGKWYDKIASGEKTSEYRACTPYWNKRFCGWADITNIHGPNLQHNWYSTVVFHRGYTNKTMEFKIKKYIDITTEPNDLGLDKCWEIKLGERITKGCDDD